MEKLRLDLDDLAVDSFATVGAREARGTVLGREKTDEYDTCAASCDPCATCDTSCAGGPVCACAPSGCVSCETSCGGGPHCDCPYTPTCPPTPTCPAD